MINNRKICNHLSKLYLTKNLKGTLKRCILSPSESCTKQCLEKQQPGNEHVRVSDPTETHTRHLDCVVNTAVYMHCSTQLTRKLSCCNAYLFLKENCLLGSLFCYTGQAEVLTPDSRVDRGPNYFLREMLKLSEVPETALTFKRGVHFRTRPMTFKAQI